MSILHSAIANQKLRLELEYKAPAAESDKETFWVSGRDLLAQCLEPSTSNELELFLSTL